MRNKAELGWIAGIIFIVVALIVGCHGAGVAPGPGGVAPPVGTATLTGCVVAADNLAQKFDGVPVSVPDAQRTVDTAADGTFTIANLPAGSSTVEVVTPTYPDYGSASATVELVAGQTTTVNLAVTPLGIPTPLSIVLDPLAATVDLHGTIVYRAQILGEGNQVIPNMVPTWAVTGGIGTMSDDGVFTAQQEGSGTVEAFAGEAQGTGNVTVVAPRPPQITSFLLNPTTLPASGGDVYISAAVSDGDGIAAGNVKAEIYGPGDETTTLNMVVTNPDTALGCSAQPNCYLEATFGVTFSAPANDNQPTADGVQAPENYSGRIKVTDRSAATSRSDFIDFVVRGIDQPPPSPDL